MPVELTKITNAQGLMNTHFYLFEEDRLSYFDSRYRHLAAMLDAPNEENFWQWRELARFHLDHYKPIPEDIYAFTPQEFLTYFPHLPLNPLSSSSSIAITLTSTNGKKDIQTPMKMGKFITMIFPDLPPTAVAKIANAYTLYMKPPELLIARTRSEIRHVYDDYKGPHSCMKRKAVCAATSLCLEGYSDISPVEAYAGPDTAVAYITKDNHVTARSVIDTTNNLFVRIYGDDSYLEPLLKKAGYRQGGLVGARLLCLESDDNLPILPYLDGDSQRISAPHRAEGTMVVTVLDEDDDEAMYVANSQYGTPELFEDENRATCEECGDRFDEDDMTYIDNLGMVCEHCLNQHFVLVHTGGYDQEYIRESNLNDVYEYGDEFYTLDALDYHNLIVVNDHVYSQDDVESDLLDESEYVVNNGDELAVPVTVAYDRPCSGPDFGWTNPDSLRYFDPSCYEGQEHLTESQLFSQNLWFDLSNARIHVGPEGTWPVSWGGEPKEDWRSAEELLSIFPSVVNSLDLDYPLTRGYPNCVSLRYETLPQAFRRAMGIAISRQLRYLAHGYNRIVRDIY